jgi:hypothetical protein
MIKLTVQLILLTAMAYMWGWRQLESGRHPWLGLLVIVGGFLGAVWVLWSDVLPIRGVPR